MDSRSSGAAGAAERAIAVLEVVGREGPGITAKAIASRLSMSPAAAYRLLNSLVASSYLVRLPDLRGFALGRGAAVLASAISPPLVCRAARVVLDDLRANIRFGVHLVMFGSAMRLADTDPDNPICDIVSFVQQPSASAAGRMFLETHLNRPSQTAAVCKPGHAGDVPDIRPRITVEHGGIRPDLASMSVAVPHSERRLLIVGALMLTAPLNRASRMAAHTPQLQQAALELSPLLS